MSLERRTAETEPNSQERATQTQLWLRIDPLLKPKIYAQIFDSAEISSLTYWLEIVFAAGIATFGLVLNSPAVIIGAMLISPLMGPIMATGLALAAGDLYLAIKALVNLFASISLSVGLSALFVWLLPFHSVTNEILSRTNPNLLDLGVALFSGFAGSIVVCRAGGSGGATALPGVAIAVALMPPLCTIGFGLGSGTDTRIMAGAGLLFLTNLVAIVSSAFLVFLLVGINSPDIREQMKHAREDEPFARMIASSPLAGVFVNSVKVHWRIVMLLVLLSSVAVPLRTALMQVAGEAVARGAVQEALRGIVPSGTLVSQQVQVLPESVTVRLIATKSVPEPALRSAERQIERRTGRRAALLTESIASRSDLAELAQRLTPMREPPPAPLNLAEIRRDMLVRVKPLVEAIWPTAAPLAEFDLAFSDGGIVLNARYGGPAELDQIANGLILKELREKLNVAELSLNAQYVRPLPPAPAAIKGLNRR